MSDELLKASVKKQVPKLCETRWSARVMTLSSVMSKYKAICLALEDIASESANTDTRIKALSFIRLLQAPAFIISMSFCHFLILLAYLYRRLLVMF